MTAYRTRKATIDDYNKVTTVNASAAKYVSGLGPVHMSVDNISVTRNFTNDGYVQKLGTIRNGGPDTMPIMFENGMGLYGTPGGDISFMREGSEVMKIDHGGKVVVSSIVSESGSIDFGGTSIVGVASITSKPGAYVVDGDRTVLDGRGIILHIPLTLPIGSQVGGSWHFTIRVHGMKSDDHTITYSRIYMCTARMPVGPPGPTGPISGIQTYQASTRGPTGILIETLPDDSGHGINIFATAATEYIWQASADILFTSA